MTLLCLMKSISRVMVKILIPNAYNATMQHDDLHYGELVMLLHYWSHTLQRNTTTRTLSFNVDLLCEGNTALVKPARSC